MALASAEDNISSPPCSWALKPREHCSPCSPFHSLLNFSSLSKPLCGIPAAIPLITCPLCHFIYISLLKLGTSTTAWTVNLWIFVTVISFIFNKVTLSNSFFTLKRQQCLKRLQGTLLCIGKSSFPEEEILRDKFRLFIYMYCPFQYLCSPAR